MILKITTLYKITETAPVVGCRATISLQSSRKSSIPEIFLQGSYYEKGIRYIDITAVGTVF
ncbi:hypothetical protein [Lysinibacillus odysseyi]|uniref:hypothetical protein n=1 Tax=Lysinibacillus odysseyi TaxID=202611 RepID=UPI001C3FE080|nr:hypothetical protein [Lysinibacillus odysseyi]